MKLRPFFRYPGAPEAARLREWHRNLLIQPNRGERARLRRSAGPEEAALAPAFHGLIQRLAIPDLSPEEHEALAALAILAARVDTDLVSGRRLGLSLGQSTGKKQANVSEARFRKLLESTDLRERLEVLRRFLPLLDKAADLRELGGVLFDWNPERRRQLAYDYYSGFTLSADSKEEQTS